MKNVQDWFKKMCTPAQIYFVIAVLAAVISLFMRESVVSVFVNFLFALIWTYILAWLCKKGYDGLSWFLVLLPYVVLLLGMAGIIRLGNLM